MTCLGHPTKGRQRGYFATACMVEGFSVLLCTDEITHRVLDVTCTKCKNTTEFKAALIRFYFVHNQSTHTERSYWWMMADAELRARPAL